MGDIKLQENTGVFPKIPLVLSVDRKDLFRDAAHELGFSVETETTLPIGDEFVTVIKVSNMWATSSSKRETRQFYGEFSSTDVLSVQSAYHVALSYLEKEGMVIINDYNSEYITQLRSSLTCSKSWAMLHELDAASLRKQVKAVGVALRELLSSVKTMLGYPHSVPATSTSKRARYGVETSLLDRPPAVLEQCSLYSSLASFEATLTPLLGGFTQDKAFVPHQTEKEQTSSSTYMQ